MSSYYYVCVLILLYVCPHATIYAVSRRLIVKLGGEEDSIAPLRSAFSAQQERVVEELQQQVRSRGAYVAYFSIRL